MTHEIRQFLVSLYGATRANRVYARLQERLTHPPAAPKGRARWTPDQRDAFLIAYPDQVREDRTPSLRTLHTVLQQHVGNLLTGLHLLPFFPASSDEGYSVMDYRRVDRRFGEWADIAQLGGTYQLMFDAVINHASVASAWFTGFLQGEPTYDDFFVTVAGDPDLSAVVRPRELPLLTAVDSAHGTKKVWTTFSADQADLNYHNPDVLLEIVDLLIFYADRRADLLRLDAIAYLWKEVGTRCIHLPQTYEVIRLLRASLDICAPHVALVTETNVPHAENITYFGDGSDMAQMVYNFGLPPLVLHAIVNGSASVLARWLSQLAVPPGQGAFLNFLASHDGIGLQPLRGILSDAEVADFASKFERAGALVSYKSDGNGGRSPYELNMNYFDAVNWAREDDDEEVKIARFLTAHAILLSLAGVPAIYFHSLFGSRGWAAGPAETGQKRSVNRQRLNRAELEAELAEPGSRRSAVLRGLSALLRARAASAAFHPKGPQAVSEAGTGVLLIRRTSPSGESAVVCLSNITARGQDVEWKSELLGEPPNAPVSDLISNRIVPTAERRVVSLSPYESVWLARPPANPRFLESEELM